LTQANEAELERVYASVPHITYRGPSTEYRAWLDSFFNMACFWAIEQWNAKHNVMAALARIHIFLNDGQDDQARKALDHSMLWESRLLALDRALKAICEKTRN
jgi:hypothetical protein